MEVVAKSEGEAESTPAVLSRGRRGPQKGLGDSTSSQAAPSSWPGDSVADTCSVPPASYSLTDHLQREASAPALPRFNKITLYLQITLPSPPPFKNKLLYAYSCVASDLPGKASALLAYPLSHVQPDL